MVVVTRSSTARQKNGEPVKVRRSARTSRRRTDVMPAARSPLTRAQRASARNAAREKAQLAHLRSAKSHRKAPPPPSTSPYVISIPCARRRVLVPKQKNDKQHEAQKRNDGKRKRKTRKQQLGVSEAAEAMEETTPRDGPVEEESFEVMCKRRIDAIEKREGELKLVEEELKRLDREVEEKDERMENIREELKKLVLSVRQREQVVRRREAEVKKREEATRLMENGVGHSGAMGSQEEPRPVAAQAGGSRGQMVCVKSEKESAAHGGGHSTAIAAPVAPQPVAPQAVVRNEMVVVKDELAQRPQVSVGDQVIRDERGRRCVRVFDGKNHRVLPLQTAEYPPSAAAAAAGADLRAIVSANGKVEVFKPAFTK